MVTMDLISYFLIGKTIGNFRKTSGNLRKTPKTAENYGNANVFTRLTNQKDFPVHGQFGLAASGYMYGNQRPEF
jgi:hypothetical protein